MAGDGLRDSCSFIVALSIRTNYVCERRTCLNGPDGGATPPISTNILEIRDQRSEIRIKKPFIPISDLRSPISIQPMRIHYKRNRRPQLAETLQYRANDHIRVPSVRVID